MLIGCSWLRCRRLSMPSIRPGRTPIWPSTGGPGANASSSSATEVQPDGRAGAAGGNGGVVRETPREPHSTAPLEVLGGRDVGAGLIAQPGAVVGNLHDQGVVVGPERHLDGCSRPQCVGEQFVRRQ